MSLALSLSLSLHLSVTVMVLLCVCVHTHIQTQPKKHAGGKMFVVLVMSYAPDGDLFSKLERAHKEQRHIPEEVCVSVK
jgi:hypothetical protein